MWLLESDKLLADRRLWLRPGKTYLFGRTPAEAGQVVIGHATISRKHLTITVDSVTEGASRNALTRTGVVLEDLATKMGTVFNGQMIKGSKYTVTGDEVEITMAKCPEVFRLKWTPVVFTFTFSSKELQAQPMEYLRERFEQLDIKLSLDYDTQRTSHVISKKRNTAKGLQALINGRFIVTESFLDAVSEVTEFDENDPSGSSLLEQDFDKYWPNAMEHLPPRGNEPVQHPDDIYTPDPERSTVFEGYTFIFYDQTQYQNLLAPITNGCGKALLRAVEPKETTVDDFVCYVKQVAGEKGLGSFDDGSEGRGVVLVRFLPAKGDLVSWYTEFLTRVSLRLDHRPIEQNEFLEAILIKDASRLRRPLEVESSMGDSVPRAREQTLPEPVYPTNSNADSQPALPIEEPLPEPQKAPAVRRVGLRRPVVKRFTGFYHNDADDIDMNDIPLAPAAQPAPSQPDQPSRDEEGLFVPQDVDAPSEDSASRARSQRKRTAGPIPEDDLMEGMAPAVAKFKRQKLHEAFAPPSPEPEPEQEQETDESAQRATGRGKGKGRAKKAKEELDVLAVAAKNREEAEARARAEQEDLAFLPEGIDLAEIRRLNIVEEMEVRAPGGAASRTRDEDVSSGRWDPKWNGVKNFKKFRRRGEPAGRQPAREIITLTEVKNKEFGVGDNYWLEDREALRTRRAQERAARRGKTPQPAVQEAPRRSARAASASNDVADEGFDFIDDDDDGGDGDGEYGNRDESSELAIRRNGRGASQANSAKRAAAPSADRDGPPAKKPRPALTLEGSDEDDSDDELKFRFGKRR